MKKEIFVLIQIPIKDSMGMSSTTITVDENTGLAQEVYESGMLTFKAITVMFDYDENAPTITFGGSLEESNLYAEFAYNLTLPEYRSVSSKYSGSGELKDLNGDVSETITAIKNIMDAHEPYIQIYF